MLGRQLNGYILEGSRIQLPRDFMAYKSQTSMSIVRRKASIDKGDRRDGITMIERNYTRELYLVGRDNGMPTAVAEAVQERHRDFTMVPNILIDGFDELSDAARFGFIRFVRLFGKQGYFIGSLRKLGKKLKVARMTINRMVTAWVQSGLAALEKQEDAETIRLSLQMKEIWEKNTTFYGVTICDTDTGETDQSVTNCDDTVTERDTPVTNCDKVSQPQAQNEAQDIYSNITSNKREESSTNVDDALPPYEEGYLEQATRIFLEWDAEDLSTTNPQAMGITDTESHIATMPTRKPATGDEEHKDVLAYLDKGAAHPRFDEPLPDVQPPHTLQDTLQDVPTRSPTRETRKRGTIKNGLTLQGQHILEEYQKFKGRKSTPGKATLAAANGLGDLVASDEEFLAVLTEIRDNKFLNDNNIARDLDFVYRKYEHYRDIVEQKAAKKLNGTSPPRDTGVRLIGGKPSDELTEAEIDALPTPFLRKAARAARSSPQATC